MRTTPQAKRIMAKLADARRQAGITQAYMADRIGVRRETVVRWERGQAEPTTTHLQGYCRAIGYRLMIEAVPLPGSAEVTRSASSTRAPSPRSSAGMGGSSETTGMVGFMRTAEAAVELNMVGPVEPGPAELSEEEDDELVAAWMEQEVRDERRWDAES